jgi:RNA polymerase sigma-70 factor (ECF subfamily)
MILSTQRQSSPHQLTGLLQDWSEGRQDALDELIPVVYDDLYRLARRYMYDERPGHTLQATALVNEAYLRLSDSANPDWQSRTHFFAVCGRIMRRILVDWARSRKALKRGSNEPPLELHDAVAVTGRSGVDLVAIDDALGALAVQDQRKSQIVEMRFFAGLSVKQTAEVLRVSEETVLRDWKLAKSWLRRELTREPFHGN